MMNVHTDIGVVGLYRCTRMFVGSPFNFALAHVRVSTVSVEGPKPNGHTGMRPRFHPLNECLILLLLYLTCYNLVLLQKI